MRGRLYFIRDIEKGVKERETQTADSRVGREILNLQVQYMLVGRWGGLAGGTPGVKVSPLLVVLYTYITVSLDDDK